VDGELLGLSSELLIVDMLEPGKCNEGTSVIIVLTASEPDEGGEGSPVRIEDTGGNSIRLS
jgi:hypothetical protein